MDKRTKRAWEYLGDRLGVDGGDQNTETAPIKQLNRLVDAEVANSNEGSA